MTIVRRKMFALSKGLRRQMEHISKANSSRSTKFHGQRDALHNYSVMSNFSPWHSPLCLQVWLPCSLPRPAMHFSRSPTWLKFAKNSLLNILGTTNQWIPITVLAFWRTACCRWVFPPSFHRYAAYPARDVLWKFPSLCLLSPILVWQRKEVPRGSTLLRMVPLLESAFGKPWWSDPLARAPDNSSRNRCTSDLATRHNPPRKFTQPYFGPGIIRSCPLC